MLFTRCPQCDTTFRITEDALRKASGQVRCGRCAHIFNAYEQLRQEEPEAVEHVVLESSAGAAIARPQAEPGSPGAAAAEVAEELERDDTVPARAVEAEAALAEDMSADDVEAILANEPREPAWMLSAAPDADEHSSLRTRWAAAAGVAGVLLCGQMLHHFRAELAAQPVIGGAVKAAYSMFGAELIPRWNVDEYDLLDWVAVAEPGANGRGNLIIRSRVQNAAAREQPYPFVQLRLLDRWEKTLGSRVFSPSEYLGTEGEGQLMAAGATAEAELVIVDPGPDAYGFELDVCVRTSDAFDCTADAVFN